MPHRTPRPVVIAVAGLVAAFALVVACNKSLDVTAPNQPPRVDTLAASATSGNAPLAVNFTATADDPDGTIASYVYDFGDGTVTAPQPNGNASHTFTVSGTFAVVVKATDDGGLVATRSVEIVVGTPPAQISFAADIVPLFSAANPRGSGNPCISCHTSGNILNLTGTTNQIYVELTADPQETGDRVNTADPPNSLVLLKPTGAVSHSGGTLWNVTDTQYQKVLTWIQQGAQNN